MSLPFRKDTRGCRKVTSATLLEPDNSDTAVPPDVRMWLRPSVNWLPLILGCALGFQVEGRSQK